MVTCPSCGSTKLQKRGTRAGKQRFRCNSCNANFTEGVPYAQGKRYLPIDSECPYCKSKKIIRRGKLADGTQRYECSDCHSSFSSKTFDRERKSSKDKDLQCPYCGSRLVYSGTNRDNKTQRFYCNSCGKSCSADKEGNPTARYIFKQFNTSLKCPRCSSLNIRKAGHGKTGTPRYMCTDCKKLFMEQPSVVVHSKETETRAIRKVLLGAPVDEIAQEFSYSTARLKRILRPWYKNEQITKEQKKDIIKYGYYLKVPVNYMATYIHCSERKCQDTIREYKKALMSTNHGAT